MCISILCDLNSCVCMFMYNYIYVHSCASMSSTLYIIVPCTLSGGRGALQMPPDCNICSVLLRLCNGIFYPLAQDLKLVSFAPISGIRFSCSLVPCSLRLSEPKKKKTKEKQEAKKNKRDKLSLLFFFVC